MSMADETGTEVRVTPGDGEVVIEVRGELDIHSAPQLDAELQQYGDTRRVVLDLQGLTFIDSAGLRIILMAHQAITGRGGELVVRAPSAPTRRLFEITGIDDVLLIEGASDSAG